MTVDSISSTKRVARDAANLPYYGAGKEYKPYYGAGKEYKPYYGAGKEYKQAKLKAAKTFRLHFMPTNLEVDPSFG